jgi:hypothetical protein
VKASVRYTLPYCMKATRVQGKLVSDIQSRLQLALTLSIFFPAILYSFFKFVGEQEQSSSQIFLKVYMLNYGRRPTNRAFRSFPTREKVCPLTGKLRGPHDEGYSSF